MLKSGEVCLKVFEALVSVMGVPFIDILAGRGWNLWVEEYSGSGEILGSAKGLIGKGVVNVVYCLWSFGRDGRCSMELKGITLIDIVLEHGVAQLVKFP
jgi:hypothetical protein